MRQIVRRVIDRKGKVVVIDLPEPHVGPDQVLVHNHYSLISSGTEMSSLSKTPAELVRQTISDPWMRKAVQQTVLAAGLSQTARRVWQEIIKPREIGYSGAGRVLAVGERVDGFRIGEKVAYAASGHAEIVAPTINHIVPVPEEVDFRHAAFVTVGGIVILATVPARRWLRWRCGLLAAATGATQQAQQTEGGQHDRRWLGDDGNSRSVGRV